SSYIGDCSNSRKCILPKCPAPKTPTFNMKKFFTKLNNYDWIFIKKIPTSFDIGIFGFKVFEILRQAQMTTKTFDFKTYLLVSGFRTAITRFLFRYLLATFCTSLAVSALRFFSKSKALSGFS